MNLFNSLNVEYIEHLAEQYRSDPESVDESWRSFFEGEEGRELLTDTTNGGPSFTPHSIFHARAAAGETSDGVKAQSVMQLINAYRTLGHLKASLDPLGLRSTQSPPQLDPAHWNLTEEDLDRTFSTSALRGPSSMTLRDLIDYLEHTYARTIGCEFMHISDDEVKTWLQARCEETRNEIDLDKATQIFILEKLFAAEEFEQFLQVKFLGAKRFSLEGAEAVIPMMSLLIDGLAQHGSREIVLGMAHRGRLNVLVNVLQKRQKQIFEEFAEVDPEAFLGKGDVKYHLGFQSKIKTRSGHEVTASLTFNPSHLEAINPVVEGLTRAKQDDAGDRGRNEIVPVLIHGDAAFIGQGLVAETLNLMNLRGYTTGGTVHIIINNQIGFTTEPNDSRSSTYCTDVAKMLDVPIFHVNGEDPEAVVQVASIAGEFRQRFGRDVIIDLYCFRRYGHNEADEPRFTQPKMYAQIEDHPTVRKVYEKALLKRGLITEEDVDMISSQEKETLEEELDASRDADENGAEAPSHIWDSEVALVGTSTTRDTVETIIRGLESWPEGFEVHRVLKRIARQRLDVLESGEGVDWGTGEALALGSLLLEGHRVRITGQDSQRGTFSHRHAVLTDQKTGEKYAPLSHLSDAQGALEIYNSPLSEASVVGFEFGYSLEATESLVCWEAQFGDFANGAQVIIDQFLSASEDKWDQRSGLVLLLPHGYEGQGPEHSSARFERFLQLCAEDNIQVCNLTTPAQIFHALRRQVLRSFRKPLVVMTPKSLLRHKRAVSSISDFVDGRFRRVIPESELEPENVKKAAFCTGKVYYDLLQKREELGRNDLALIRIEQLYPFPEDAVLKAIEDYANLDEVIWCQEEPENMGAFYFLHPRLTRLFPDLPLRWVNREASASPATGYKKAHVIEQAALLADVYQEPEPEPEEALDEEAAKPS